MEMELLEPLVPLVPVMDGALEHQQDNEPIEVLLSSWDLSHLIDFFNDKNINSNALMIMGGDELQELLQELTVDDRVVLKDNLEQWKSDTSQTCERGSNHSKPNVIDILNQSSTGRLIIDTYKNCETISEEHRRKLMDIIVDYFDSRSIEMDLRTSYRLEKEILDIFPTEKHEYYRTSKRGKIYTKFHNKKRMLKSLRVNTTGESSIGHETNKDDTSDNEQIDALLSSWGLSHLKKIFKAENITTNTLKLMGSEEVQELLQKLTYADNARLKYNLQKWRSQMNIPLVINECRSSTAPNTLPPPPRASQRYVDDSRIKVIDIMTKHRIGCRIIDHYKKHKKLTDEQRKLMLNVIVEYFDSRAIVLNLRTSHRLEREILKMFPTEKLANYRRSARGKLYLKFHNKKRLLKSFVTMPIAPFSEHETSTDSVDNEPMDVLLSSWDLSHLIDFFNDKNINANALKIMGEDELQELLQELTVGDRVVLKDNLEQWKSANNIPQNVISECDNFTAVSQSYKGGSNPLKPNVMDILNQHSIGRLIMDIYKNTEAITEEHRRKLMDIIVDHFDAKAIDIDLHTSYRLEEEILDIFPNEKLEYYRTRKRGKIYTRFHNKKRLLKSFNVNTTGESSIEHETNKDHTCITGDNEEIGALLSSWKLSHLTDFFHDKNITAKTLKIMGSDDLQELLQELSFGDRVVLRGNFEHWKSAYNTTNESINVQDTSQSYMREPKHPEIKLIDILKQHTIGRRIMEIYKNSQSFADDHRKKLLDIVADYFDSKAIEMDLQTSHRLEEEILKLFPAEKLEYYRTSRRGKLYNKFRNKKRYLKAINAAFKTGESSTELETNNEDTCVRATRLSRRTKDNDLLTISSNKAKDLSETNSPPEETKQPEPNILICRLCRNNCKDDSICLRESDGHTTKEYDIAIKYFHPTFLEVDNEAITSLTVLCNECWQHISGFYDFKQRVLLIQANFLKEVEVSKNSQEPKEQISSKCDGHSEKRHVIVTDCEIKFETHVKEPIDDVSLTVPTVKIEPADFSEEIASSDIIDTDQSSECDEEVESKDPRSIISIIDNLGCIKADPMQVNEDVADSDQNSDEETIVPEEVNMPKASTRAQPKVTQETPQKTLKRLPRKRRHCETN